MSPSRRVPAPDRPLSGHFDREGPVAGLHDGLVRRSDRSAVKRRVSGRWLDPGATPKAAGTAPHGQTPGAPSGGIRFVGR